jgi:hypothetical protein
LIQDAVVRNLQVLAESSQRLSEEATSADAQIQWRAIAGFRNIELLGIHIQPLQDPRRLAGDIAALALADHPAGRVHEFQVVVEGKGNRRRHAAGGIEWHQRSARQGAQVGFQRMRG